MSWTVTPQLKTLAGTAGAIPEASILGLPIDGGFFAGYISHTADGNPTLALIVAPRATGATGIGTTGSSYTLTTALAWKTATTTTANTTSPFDGSANTAAMVAAGISDHPAAEFCVNLSIGGFADWYLPSRYELDIAYFNLKPSADDNSTLWGINDYSVPKRTSNFTLSYPSQTTLSSFNTNTERFALNRHYSSTQFSSTAAWALNFTTGIQQNNMAGGKGFLAPVRAFRRIAL
jgi:hypothetical protein